MTLVELLAATIEVVGAKVSEPALRLMEHELSGMDQAKVESALSRCMRECSGRLALKDILDRLDTGVLGPEEAWAIASAAQNETATVVWTKEMRDAFWGAANPLLQDGDKIGARMAFKEAYTKLTANSGGVAPTYIVSLGCPTRDDPHERVRSLAQAVQAKLIPARTAVAEIPDLDQRRQLLHLVGTKEALALMPPEEPIVQSRIADGDPMPHVADTLSMAVLRPRRTNRPVNTKVNDFLHIRKVAGREEV